MCLVFSVQLPQAFLFFQAGVTCGFLSAYDTAEVKEVMYSGTHRTMADAQVSEEVTVSGIRHTGAMKKRLTELGLTVGTKTVCRLHSCHGDMLMFSIRGACIAMRKCDLALIDIT